MLVRLFDPRRRRRLLVTQQALGLMFACFFWVLVLECWVVGSMFISLLLGCIILEKFLYVFFSTHVVFILTIPSRNTQYLY